MTAFRRADADALRADADRLFKLLGAANAVLSDARKRAAHDADERRRRAAPARSHHSHHSHAREGYAYSYSHSHSHGGGGGGGGGWVGGGRLLSPTA